MTIPVEIERILAPVEFDDCSRRALAYALSLARAFDAQLHVVHAVPPPTRQIPAYATTGQLSVGTATTPAAYVHKPQELQRLAERLETMVAEHSPGSGLRISTDIQIVGVETLVTDTSHYDLVVMGSHDRPWLAGLLLRSHAKAAVAHATCPVLVVPDAGESPTEMSS